MKKLSIYILVIFMSQLAYSQVTVSYHQSAVPFVAGNYSFDNGFMTELRVMTNIDFEDVGFEGDILYKLIEKEDYAFYAGVGFRYFIESTAVIPVGINIYPFENKNFGFQAELAPWFGGESISVLRSSWGIRYRFGE